MIYTWAARKGLHRNGLRRPRNLKSMRQERSDHCPKDGLQRGRFQLTFQLRLAALNSYIGTARIITLTPPSILKCSNIDP